MNESNEFIRWDHLKVKGLVVVVSIVLALVADAVNADSKEASQAVALPDAFELLFIGNSHSASHGLPNLVAMMIETGLPGRSASATLAPGYGYLSDRLEDGVTQQSLESRTWTHVILQAQKYSTSGMYSYPTFAAEEWIRRVKAQSAEPILFPEWPREGNTEEGPRVHDLHLGIASREPACVAPVGLVWEEAIRAFPELDLYAPDGNHSNINGATLTAFVFYQVITGQPASGLPYIPGIDVSADTQQKLRDAAVAIVAGPFCPSLDGVFAQTIGKHYALPLVLVESGSEHDVYMNQPEVLDINNDGRDDVVFSASGEVSEEAPNPLYFWIGNQAGSMQIAADELIVGVIPDAGYRQIIPADFNRDGRLDLFLESHGAEPDCGDDGGVGCWTGGPNSLLLSNDEGTLDNVTETHVPALSDFTHGSSVIDFDGDGDLDIWVNNLGGSWGYDVEFGYLLSNDGLGKFTMVADASPDWDERRIMGKNGILPDVNWSDGPWSMAVDADGDGNVDLALPGNLNTYTGDVAINWLFHNDGGRFSFVEEDAWPNPIGWLELPFTQHALVYDLNNDNLDDMLLHQTIWIENNPRQISIVQILISNGDGTFRDESSDRYPDGGYQDLSDFQLHDLDGDGHKDIFSSVDDAVVDIRVNDGEGYFRQLNADWVQTDWHWVVLDVDGDGGTDFLVNGHEGITLSKMNLPYGAVLDGTVGDDRLIGGAFDNVYRGLEGNDVLDGGLGDDDLDGGAGDDKLIGGKGDERLTPGPGADSVDGGPGRDLVEYDFPMDEAQILPDQITLISKQSGSSNDQIENTEYALFTDGATPLPTGQQSTIASLNGVAGLWYDPDLDGEGFNVITTPTGTVIFFYGYTANGQRLWLVSETYSGDIAFDKLFDLQMYEAQGGTFDQPAPPSEALSEWGHLQGLFDACGTGRFALNGDDGVKVTYQIKLAGITNADCTTETLSAPSGLAGLWYDAALNGEGYNIIVTESSTVFFFYGYDTNGKRLWLVSEATADAPVIGEAGTLKMYSASGGTFDEPAMPSQALSDWGELEVTFSGCGTALARLTGEDGEKTSNLSKLAGISQSTCP